MNQIKYDPDGSAYRIEELPAGAVLAYPQIVSAMGKPGVDGPLCILDKSVLHDDPPRQQLDGEVAEAKVVLADLNEQIKAAGEILTGIVGSAAERVARPKQETPLKHLDDLLAGRIAYFVETKFYDGLPPQLITWHDVETYQLTLWCGTNGDVKWKHNCHSGESGYTRTVIPCVSYEEALGEVVKLFAAHETDAMNPKCRITPSRQWVKQATKYGLAMTDLYIHALEELEASARQTKLAKLKSEIQTLEARKK